MGESSEVEAWGETWWTARLITCGVAQCHAISLLSGPAPHPRPPPSGGKKKSTEKREREQAQRAFPPRETPQREVQYKITRREPA